jgi:RHS repeat-associated protein
MTEMLNMAMQKDAASHASFNGFPRAKRWARRVVCTILAVALPLHSSWAHAQTVYYHNDAAGSPIAATDEGGELLWRESYRPYGERLLKPAAANTQWFSGKQMDADTGLQDFGARNYDPVLGRFLSIDPVDFEDKNIHSFNRYAYANNNPLRYKDPDGRSSILIEIGVAVVIVGIIIGATPNYGSTPTSTPAQSDAGMTTPPSVASSIDRQIGGFVAWVKDSAENLMSSKPAKNDFPAMAPDKGRGLGAKAPDAIPPTGKPEVLRGQYVNELGQVQPWTAHYDKFGRQVERTDEKAGNKAQGIPDTHHHTQEYDSKSWNHGPTTTDHVPGPGPNGT